MRNLAISLGWLLSCWVWWGLTPVPAAQANFTFSALDRVTGQIGDWRFSEVSVSIMSVAETHHLFVNHWPTNPLSLPITLDLDNSSFLILPSETNNVSEPIGDRQIIQIEAQLSDPAVPGIAEPQLFVRCNEQIIWSTQLSHSSAGTTNQLSWLLPLNDCTGPLKSDLKTEVNLGSAPKLTIDHVNTNVIWLAASDKLWLRADESTTTVYASQSCRDSQQWQVLNQLLLSWDSLQSNCQLSYWSVDAAGNISPSQELFLLQPPTPSTFPPVIIDHFVQSDMLYLRLTESPTASTGYHTWLITGQSSASDQPEFLDWRLHSLESPGTLNAPADLAGDEILQVNMPEKIKSVEIRYQDVFGQLSLPARLELE